MPAADGAQWAWIFGFLSVFEVNSLSRTLAACGLIALSSSALADTSSVTVYGRVDTAIESIKLGNTRTSNVSSSGSYFGIQGQEQLGNGMKVGFQLEAAFDSDDGQIATAERNFFSNRSELNLSGTFGTLRVGSFFNPSYYAVADRASLHNEDYGITADALYAGVENNANRIAYASPEFHGLTVESAVSFHERDAEPRKHAYDLAANYDMGDWSFGAGFSEWGDAQQYALRATWTQGDWTVSGYHQRSKHWNAADFEVAAGDGNRNVTRLAVAYAIGAGEVHANYGHANGPRAEEANQWTVGYNHHLSKRTKVYAFYSQLQNKDGADFGGLNTNEDRKSVSVGVRHHF